MNKIPNTKYQIPKKTTQDDGGKTRRVFDLEERTTVFAEATIKHCKRVPSTGISKPLINQLVRAATSVGANYMEANNASSKKDFRNKIYISKKEVQEANYWLRLLRQCISSSSDLTETSRLQQESQELARIFQAIASKVDGSEE